MKTTSSYRLKSWIQKSLVSLSLILITLSVQSQTFPYLSFTGAALKSGTALQQGAVYKFTNVTTGVDAFVTIQSVLNGASVTNIDQFGGTGYDGGFQPIVSSSAGSPDSYARFLIEFKNTDGSAHTFPNLATTGLDIDGTTMSLLEYCTINMNGGIATFDFNSSELSIAKIGTAYKASDIAGNNVSGIDSTHKEVMFTVRNANVSSLTIDFGSVRTSGSDVRNYSAFFGDFQYPTPGVLPIKLISFDASLENDNVQLSWITSQEMNSHHFELERSIDGNDYNQVAVVTASGNSENKIGYNYPDNIASVSGRVISYRLKMVDVDGKFSYSNVRVIRLGNQKEQSVSIQTYPNPASNVLHITVIKSWQGRKVTYEVFAANGQAVIKNETGNSSQTETINVNRLIPGFYTVRVSCNNEVAMQKIIKR